MSAATDLFLTLEGQSEPMQFTSPRIAVDFVARELQRWEALASGHLNNAHVPQPVRSALNASFKLWREHLSQATLAAGHKEPAESENGMRGVLAGIESQVRERRIVVSTSPLGRTIFALAESNPLSAAYLFSLNSGTELSQALSPADSQAIVGLLRSLPSVIQALTGNDTAVHAAREAASSAAEAETSRDRVTEVLAEVTVLRTASEEKWEEFRTEAATQRDQALQDMRDKAARQLTAMEERAATQESTFLAGMRLRAPREYWAGKAKTHRKAWLLWGAGFIVVLVAGLVAAEWATPYIADILHDSMAFKKTPAVPSPSTTAVVAAASVSDEGRWVVPFVSLGIHLFVVLWLARLMSRQVSEHLLREEDARERLVMVETFLALNSSETGEALEGLSTNFPVILQAIFRPGPGMGADDSPPVGLIDAVLKAARPGASK